MCGQIMKIFIFLLALFWSASQVFADECKTKPDECTPKNLCEVATEIKNGKTIWSEAIKSNQHVVFAKELDINCGVVELTDPCDNDANECSIKQLCEKATITTDNTKTWNSSAAAYVALALEYGLTCEVPEILIDGTEARSQKITGSVLTSKSLDVPQIELQPNSVPNAKDLYDAKGIWIVSPKNPRLTNNTRMNVEEIPSTDEKLQRHMASIIQEDNKVAAVTKKTCSQDPSVCSTSDLCEKATFRNGTKKWSTFYVKHVDEAKSRGLTCGVTEQVAAVIKESCSEEPKNCSLDDLCRYAVTFSKETNIWAPEYVFSKHVTEAKRRGLTCGVKEQVAAVTKKTCSQDPSACSTFDDLCNTATYTSLGKRYWNNVTLMHVTEAKRLGLTCGVEVQLSAQTKKICNDDLNLCSETQICNLSTVTLGSRRIWSSIYKNKDYVIEAKRRGLTCGVKEQLAVVKKTTCRQDPSVCSTSDLCEEATFGNGAKKWSTLYIKHVNEAKRRALTCGVKDTKSDNKNELLGDWAGSITCSGTAYPMTGKLFESGNVNRVQMNTANYSYNGSFSINAAKTRISLNANRNDGEVFGETFDIDSTLSRISGKTSRGCFLSGERVLPIQTVFNRLTRQQKFEVQTKLKEYGFYNSNVDGLFGPSTKKALLSFMVARDISGDTEQKAEALMNQFLTNKTNSSTYTQPSNTYQDFTKTDFLELSVTQRKQLQYGLKKLGHYNSYVDGVWGKNTDKAVNNYRRSVSIETGYPMSVLNSLASKVSLPTSFAVAKKKAPVKQTDRPLMDEATGQAAAALLCTAITGNAAGCISGATGNKRNPYDNLPSSYQNTTSNSSCNSDFNCGSREICVKKPNMRYGKGICVTIPKGEKKKTFSAQSCKFHTDCGTGSRCDSTYKICVER